MLFARIFSFPKRIEEFIDVNELTDVRITMCMANFCSVKGNINNTKTNMRFVKIVHR